MADYSMWSLTLPFRTHRYTFLAPIFLISHLLFHSPSSLPFHPLLHSCSLSGHSVWRASKEVVRGGTGGDGTTVLWQWCTQGILHTTTLCKEGKHMIAKHWPRDIIIIGIIPYQLSNSWDLAKWPSYLLQLTYTLYPHNIKPQHLNCKARDSTAWTLWWRPSVEGLTKHVCVPSEG